MRLFKFFLSLFSSLLFLGCLSTDDDEYRPIWLTAQNAFDFPLQNEFSVGDTLYVEQYFSRYLPEEGYEELLDVYETTKDEEFGYSFQIEKYSNLSQDYNWVDLDPQFILGNKVDGGYNSVEILALLNSSRDAYESRFGIVLAEAGSFRLNLSHVIFHNGYDQANEIYLDIRHEFSNEEEALWEFTVTE
ncbi:MAG: hypothetical protein CML04_04850 [Pseudozobellia sp.]|nr:hypothetical protein [Pseudozobellia sp.]MBG46805.1 hypothetical protein [Pseudozobellia sp.]|tara:strand:- start:1115797 stop:1116363 length:567 start_codon:yes stop_codon:yes gene_type:complete